MGLLDLFTGAASERAARNNTSAIGTGLTQGSGALMTTGQNALRYLLGAPGQAGALQVTDRGYDQARDALGQSYGDTRGALTKLGELYEPMTRQGQGAFDLYQDALGANGTEGQGRARSAFQTDPGYQFQQDQGLGAIQRSAASRGGLAGGNTTVDILKYSQGLADQSYNQFVNRLGQGAQAYGQGIAGQAGALQGQASASQGYGNALSALDTGRGSALAGTLGSAAGVQTALGQGLAGLTNNATSAFTQNNSNLAQSQNAAGANILGGILGLVNAGANIYGGVNGRNAIGGGR